MKHNHQWGEWVGYDPMAFEFGLTDGFLYRRECMIMGCQAQQRAERLEPVGKIEVRFEDKEDDLAVLNFITKKEDNHD